MLKRLFIIASVVAVFTLWGYAYFVTKSPTQRVSVAQNVVVDCSFSKQVMIDDINSVRTHKLVEDSYLDSVAQNRADSIPYELDHHVGFHVLLSDGTLKGYSLYGEILASNHCFSTTNIFTQWRNSPGHWTEITRESYDSLGVGSNGQSAVVIFGDN